MYPYLYCTIQEVLATENKTTNTTKYLTPLLSTSIKKEEEMKRQKISTHIRERKKKKKSPPAQDKRKVNKDPVLGPFIPD